MRRRPEFLDRLGKADFRTADELLMDLAAVPKSDETAGKIARAGSIHISVLAMLGTIDALLNSEYFLLVSWFVALFSWRQWHLLRNS